MNIKQISKYLLLLIMFVCSQASWAQSVGQIQYTRGAVTIQNMDGNSARLIAKNEKLQRGEVLNTGPGSFAIVKLNDGTHMTIRPNSLFSVEQFNAKEDATASAVLRLFRGGMRAITGYIGKKNPGGYIVKTDVTTLTIHGTEFDARLCQHDCEEENIKHNKAYDKIAVEEALPGLYVSVSKGYISLKNKSGMRLEVKAGQSVYADVLGRMAKQLPKTPVFQQFDAYPLPDVANPAVINVNANGNGNEDPDIFCEI